MKLKLSWQHFIITILILIILACLVNYLGNNNIIEGLENNSEVKSVYTGEKNRQPQEEGTLFQGDGKEIRPMDAVTNEKDFPGEVPNKAQLEFAKSRPDVYEFKNVGIDEHNADNKKESSSTFQDSSIDSEGGEIELSKNYLTSPREAGTGSASTAISKNEPNPNESNYIGVSETTPIIKLGKEGKKEGFTNLSGAPISSEGPDGCLNPLAPYKKYSCGPVSVDNFFGDIQFKPECCGNPAGSSYSNSMGCACICPEQWNYLNSRGGNRTFPSQF